MKKSAKQVMLTEVSPKELEFDYSSLQTVVAERVADMSSMARAAAPALIPLCDGFVKYSIQNYLLRICYTDLDVVDSCKTLPLYHLPLFTITFLPYFNEVG